MPADEHTYVELTTGSICSMMPTHSNRASLPSIVSAHRFLPCSIKSSDSPTLETTELSSDPTFATSFIADPSYISSQVTLIDSLHAFHESMIHLIAEESGMASTARTTIAEVNIRSNSSTDRLQTCRKCVLSARLSRASLDIQKRHRFSRLFPRPLYCSFRRTCQPYTRETGDR